MGARRVVFVNSTDLVAMGLHERQLVDLESTWDGQVRRAERVGAADRAQVAVRGDEQLRHTAAICAFAYHARKRGYDTLVCPQVEGLAEPDILLTNGQESLYVEVQRQGGERWRRAAKWRNLLRLQDEVILCTATPLSLIHI